VGVAGLDQLDPADRADRQVDGPPFPPPGYRGAWRSMHLGGRVPRAVARRLSPGWLERTSGTDDEPAALRR
jgi:hypothetical protein